MSWLRNYTLTIGMAILVAACGFTPLYEKPQGDFGDEPGGLYQKLAAIEVETPKGDESRLAQELHTNLTQVLDPMGRSGVKLYRLALTTRRENLPSAIQRDREITRYNVTIATDYVLTSLTDGSVVDKGNVRLRGSYDTVESQFATYVAEQDTAKRIIKETAEALRMRMVGALEKKPAPPAIKPAPFREPVFEEPLFPKVKIPELPL
ncbi:MAG: hypothetical protein K0R63_1396 [Rickettsiales bacterium]|nr:hypothetical protein [Rickettsiales bacterium]